MGSRGAATVGAWAAGTAAAFGVYLRLAQTQAVNSDAAAQALQAWDVLHGNVLLRGWTTSDVSFYTTEIPQYALVELIRGLRTDAVDIAAAMTYTLVVLLAALLAQGKASGRRAALAITIAVGIMLAPQLDSGTNVLLSSPDHIGTSVPLLATWLVLDRGGRRWYVPVITSGLLAWAQVADSMTTIAGIVPLTLVCALHTRSRRALPWKDSAFECGVGGGALLAAAVARLVLAAITSAGGFTVQPLAAQFASLAEIFGHNLRVGTQCLLLLFGAYTGGPATGEWRGFLFLHLAGVLLAVVGIGAAAWRSRRGGDLVSQVLLAAIAVTVAAFLVTQRVFDVSAAREIAPVLPFAAALAGRQLGGHLLRLARPPLFMIGAGYVAGLAALLTVPPAAPSTDQLTTWLEQHRLGGLDNTGLSATGLAGYWQAGVVTLASGGSVAVRPVADDRGGVGPHRGEISAAWYDPARSAAHFVVLSPTAPGRPGYADTRAVLATWGAPARVYHVGQYTIWYWPKNLLTAIRR